MRDLKDFIKKHFPNVVEKIKEKQSNKAIFKKIYERNSWESDESISGPGSTLQSTQNLRVKLEQFFEDYQIKTIIDAPCGDFNWFKEIDCKFDSYKGFDIVDDVINNNNSKYKSDTVEFCVSDISKNTLPKADLILCRDCLVHLSYEIIFKIINNFKNSGSKFLLTTTYPELQDNKNITTGDWRKINLRLEPFNFPEEILSISEDCIGNDKNASYSKDKYLSLWELNDV